MPSRIKRRFRGLPTLVLAATLSGILLCVLAISFLATNVQREVNELGVANSDTTQWTLVQAEVELLALLVAVHDAEVHDSGQAVQSGLQELRRRYDVLYSRVRLIGESRQFADLRNDPGAAGSLAALNAFLDKHTPAIDGSDAELAAQLPSLLSDLVALRATGRSFSLLGVRFYAEDSDRKRESVAATLATIGYLTLALVLALLGGIAILMAMYRRSIRSERSAADARNRLQEVIATSLDGIIASDVEGRVIEYNGAAERVFGYTRDEALGQDMADLVVPDHLRTAHVEGMRRYRKTGERRVVGKGLVRLEAKRKNGTVFPVELSLSSITFGGREIIVSFLRDISDRVASEQELILTRDRAVAGERAKAELLAVMSHEMRTPLNGILGTVELLQDTKLTARQERFLAAMKTSAGLLLHHVNGVLSMSRAEAGQLDLVATEIDPAGLLTELVASQVHVIEAHGNRIHCDTKAAPPVIWGDPLRLRQVILNLVGNANKFTRNGEIRVECDSIPDLHQVEFRVLDTGIGIAEEHLDQIFEEFRTLDSSYARQAEGTGLGLAISRRLVLAMGGEIGVDSEPGEGSLFWVRLPVGKPAPRQDRPKKVAAARPVRSRVPAKALRLLLVEDNQINRLVAREMLQKSGHIVVEAHDGREGVHAAGQQAFDAILMDISMPEMDGVEATRVIRGADGPNRRTPIIALTAHALAEDTQRFLAAGINETLVKPLSIAALQEVLAGVGEIPAPVAAPRPEAVPETATSTLSGVFGDLVESLGRDKSARLMASFQTEAEALVQRTASAGWEDLPMSDRADAVHKVAGSAAVLGAAGLHAALQSLEGGYRQGDAVAIARGLEMLAQRWQATRAEIQGCLEVKDQA
ncbi:PAS domain-containing hybrid sensor histidine kinase/response regulator [Tabrizicola sp.]|uniref:hybrid sensor histidine kinase/response regulator n=1 Tax=Tabrizicola sp. TaxID=2005166 RepID=UPI0026006C87|nr:PAS domain-containing hybrid sensor histidine kinase/response regulator [Tabrizicola sp.]